MKRKRSASPTLIHRRRRIQSAEVEISASPSLNMARSAESGQTPNSGLLTLDSFTKYMDEKVMVQITEVRTRIDRVSVQVNTNSDNIEAMQSELDKIKAERSGGALGRNGDDAELRRYDRSRRSIRIWPVRGKTSEEIWTNTGRFIHSTLRISADDMRDELIEDIRRLRSSGAGRINNEVLVIFCDIESRDLVTAHSKHLSTAVDDQGNPKAGLRLDIPLHLMSTFKSLEAHGHKMRMRYGNDFKRHVRFDDDRKSLYLNVRLPGERLWTRISPDFARECAWEIVF